MNIADAAYAVVHDYPGGSESLAPRIGMSAAILRNKVNPNNTTHHLTVAEADRITGVTGDLRIVHAFSATHGVLGIPVGDEKDASDMAVLEAMSGLWERNGALGTAVHGALADGDLTQVELRNIRAAALAVYGRIGSLLSRLDAMAQPEVSRDA